METRRIGGSKRNERGRFSKNTGLWAQVLRVKIVFFRRKMRIDQHHFFHHQDYKITRHLLHAYDTPICLGYHMTHLRPIGGFSSPSLTHDRSPYLIPTPSDRPITPSSQTYPDVYMQHAYLSRIPHGSSQATRKPLMLFPLSQVTV